MWWAGDGGGASGNPDRPSTDIPEQQSDIQETELKQELSDLQEQFSQQQQLLGQLKIMIKSNESQFQHREREIADYSERLSRIRPRLRSTASEADYERASDASSHFGEPSVLTHLKGSEHSLVHSSLLKDRKSSVDAENSSRSKILLLRRQVEEHRLKFERQQRENIEKRALMDEMKDRIDKLRMEIEERDSLIMSLQEEKVSDAELTYDQLYQQIVYKDNTILDLTQKNNYLEDCLQEKMEELNEKDKLINARTEAVSLITKDRDEKTWKAMEDLDATKLQVQSIQSDFQTAKSKWVNDQNNFNRLIDQKTKKILQLEENCKRLENLRFELSTKNAELQEKVVDLQTQSQESFEKVAHHKKELDEKQAELKDMKQKLNAAEAYGKKKLISLEKQLKSIKEGEDFNEQILYLQNEIAVLEEEKGNLQLKLVDFDDYKMNNKKLENAIMHLEEKIKQMDKDLDLQLNAITILENEKITLVESLNEKENKLCDFEVQYEDTVSELSTVKQEKVTLELKLCEVEEQRDQALKNLIDNENSSNKEFVHISDILKDKEVLEDILSNKEKKVKMLEEKCTSLNESMFKLQDGEKIAKTEVKKKTEENRHLLIILTEKENALTLQTLQIEKHDETVKSFNTTIEDLQNALRQKNSEVLQLQHEFNALSSKASLVDNKFLELSSEVNLKHKALKSQMDANALLELTIKEKNSELQAASSSFYAIKLDLEQKEATVKGIKEELQELQISYSKKLDEIKDLTDNIKALSSNLMHKEDEVRSALIDLEMSRESVQDCKSNYEKQIFQLTCEFKEKNSLCAKVENENKMLNNELKSLEESKAHNENLIAENESCILSLSAELEIHQMKLNNIMHTVEEKNLLLTDKENELLQLHLELEGYIKSSYVLEEEMQILSEKLKSVSEFKDNLNTDYGNLLKERDQLLCSISEKESVNNTLREQIKFISGQREEQTQFLSQECQQNSEKILELQDIISSLKDESSNYLTSVEKLNNELSEKGDKLLKLYTDLETSVSKVKQLENELSLVKGDLAVRNSQVNEYHAAYETTVNSSRIIDEKNKELEIRIHELELCCSELDGSANETREKLTVCSSELKKTELLLEEKVKQLMLIELELENSKSENFVYDKKVKELEKNVEVLQMQLKDSVAHISDLEKSLSKIKAWSLELQQKSETYEKECELLKENLLSKEQEFEHVNNNLASLEAENITLNGLIRHEESKFSENEALYQQLNSLQNDMLALHSSKNELEEIFNKKVLELLESNDLCSNLQSKVSEMEQIVNEKDTKLNSLKAELDIGKVTKLENITEKLQDLAYYKVEAQSAYNKYYNCEVDLSRAKEQLKEAQQIILELQTSISMQQIMPVVSDKSTGSWGDISLADSSSSEKTCQKYVDVDNLEKSLIEKDNMISVMQDQIREGLMNVNTLTEEKKVLEHKMKVLESTAEERLRAWNKLQSELKEASMQLTDIKEVNYNKIEELERELSERKLQIHYLKVDMENMRIKYEDVSENENTDVQVTSSEGISGKENSMPNIEELQYKLSWYEENWNNWTEYCNHLQSNYEASQQQVCKLNEQINELMQNQTESKNNDYQNINTIQLKRIKELELSLKSTLDENDRFKNEILKKSEQLSNAEKVDYQRLRRAEEEVDRLRSFETQVYELQNQVQTLQHQCNALQIQIQALEKECSELREVDILYKELQTCMLESEIKREGSVSRLHELELMVDSAESEISRLRNEIQTVTDLNSELHQEKAKLDNFAQDQEREVSHLMEESERVNIIIEESSSLKLQIEGFIQENNQLRSEIEVLEGDQERMRIDFDILESENTRLKTDYEVVSNASQMVEAEKESLESEIQRMTIVIDNINCENCSLKAENQQMDLLCKSLRSENVKLNSELERFLQLDTQYNELEQKYNDIYSQLLNVETLSREKVDSVVVEEVDWGTEATYELEHLQKSGADSLIVTENKNLKKQIIQFEKEKTELCNEITTLKLKNGKLLQKFKYEQNKNEVFQKEIQNLKSSGLSDLDQALEMEWKAQIDRAEAERDEVKVMLDRIEKEKISMSSQLDVLQDAQEKYLELKENQDSMNRAFQMQNKELTSKVEMLEWKLCEFESNVTEDSSYMPSSVAEQEDNLVTENNEDLLQENVKLKKNISDLKEEVTTLKEEAREFEERIECISKDNETFQSLIEGLKEAKKKAEIDSSNYKSLYLELYDEHDILKKDLANQNEELQNLNYRHVTLKTAYDSLFSDYHEVEGKNISLKYDKGILEGERDRLFDEVGCLKSQLVALNEDEEEDVICSLHDQVLTLQDVNNDLKDKVTELSVTNQQFIDKIERAEHAAMQQKEMHNLLQDELEQKNEDIKILIAKNGELEREIKYMKAEINALNSQIAHLKKANKKSELGEKEISETLAFEEEGEEDSVITSQTPITTTYVSTLPVTHDLEDVETLPDVQQQHYSLEITKLLEERDALQLKLSAALRQNQDLSRELSLSHQLPQPSVPQPDLNQKLAELRELNDSLEQKTFESLHIVDTQERKKISSLSAQTLFVPRTAPPTPSATRYHEQVESSQGSPSLIGWIMGKSSPKVLHV